MVFIFQFVNVVYYIDLWILKNPCIPGIKPTWSWCMIFLICCWILFARILLRILASMFIRKTNKQTKNNISKHECKKKKNPEENIREKPS